MTLRSLLTLGRTRPLLSSAFVLACLFSLFFAGRLIFFAVYWSDPAHQYESLKPWMTTGYIAKSWRLDAREIDAVAGLPVPQERGHPMTLRDIATERGVPIEDIYSAVEAALSTLTAQEDAQEGAPEGAEPKAPAP